MEKTKIQQEIEDLANDFWIRGFVLAKHRVSYKKIDFNSDDVNNFIDGYVIGSTHVGTYENWQHHLKSDINLYDDQGFINAVLDSIDRATDD